jgi:hypothetical protein
MAKKWIMEAKTDVGFLLARQLAGSSWATTIQSAFILLIKKRNCEAVFPSKCSKIPHSRRLLFTLLIIGLNAKCLT